MSDKINDVNHAVVANVEEDNTSVRLRLQPVLPVMMIFGCECTNPPTELPAPFEKMRGKPERFRHRCPSCGKRITLNHASGSVVFQKINKPDEGPKLEVVQRIPS